MAIKGSKNKTYLIVGNNTFSGFAIGEHIEKCGGCVKHIYYPRQNKRNTPEEYFQQQNIPEWSEMCESIEGLIHSIRRSVIELRGSITVIATGDVEFQILHHLKIPHYWFTDGADISEHPFGATASAMRLNEQIRSSDYLWGLISTQRDAWYAARLLGRSKQILRIGLPPSPRILSEEYKIKCDEVRTERFSHINPVSRIIVLASRKVYSGSATFSKGTEHVVRFLNLLGDLSAAFTVVSVSSGPDAARFAEDCKRVGANVKIFHEPHLNQIELHSLLTMGNTVLLDQFGEKECQMSGLIRESLALGVPTITDHMFFPGFSVNLPFPVPTLTAHTGEEILAQYLYLIDDDNYRDVSSRCRMYCDNLMSGQDFFLALRELKSVTVT